MRNIIAPALLLGLALSGAVASPASAFGKILRLVDKEVQIAGYGIRNLSDGSGENVCVAYVGWRDLYKADKQPTRQELVNLADQAFEELIGTECKNTAVQNTATGKFRVVGNARVFVGDEITYVEDRYGFTDALAKAEASDARIDYRRSSGIGADFDPDQSGKPPASIFDAEFIRTSQSEIPVEPSHREPSLVAVPTEIAPGVVIGLENKWTITYTGERKPTLLVQYQTDVSIADVVGSKALAAQVADFFGKDMLVNREVGAVRVGAYNEPRRSRFHFRPFYSYSIDRQGEVLSNSDLAPADSNRSLDGAHFD